MIPVQSGLASGQALAAGLLICPRGAGVAHLFGKEEVTGPNPVVGSIDLILLGGDKDGEAAV